MDFLVKPNLQVFFVFFFNAMFFDCSDSWNWTLLYWFYLCVSNHSHSFSLIIFYHLLMTIMLTIFFLKISTPVTTTITYIRASKSFACLTFTYLLSHFTSDPEITVFQWLNVKSKNVFKFLSCFVLPLGSCPIYFKNCR